MGTKRIILEIEESLHKRIKDFAAKDKRTLTVVLRIMTEEMLDKLVTNKETLQNNYKNVLPDNSIGQIAQSDRLSNVDKMTDEERKAIADASF